MLTEPTGLKRDTTTSDRPASPASLVSATRESDSMQPPGSQHRSDPLIGQTVAQYEIVARLGAGGMGVVYLARDRKLGRPVALKFLRPERRNDESAKEHFIGEAQAASATNHRSICTIYDLQEAASGQMFIVMAYYAGHTLKQRLDAGALSVRQALGIAVQVADGLAAAHAQGIVHRDIKPGNLMLTADGVKILDFGIAKFKHAIHDLTPTGAFGTVAYMSPEQLRGEEVDERSDLWALGIVLYEMLSGHRPFNGTSLEGMAHAIWTGRPLPPEVSRPDVPKQVGRLVLKALRKEPARRFQTAAEFADQLREASRRLADRRASPRAIAQETSFWKRLRSTPTWQMLVERTAGFFWRTSEESQVPLAKV
jgi:serine/threonine-protein kinase